MNSRLISLIASMLLTCLLPLGAQMLPWQSTSTIQDANSNFTPSVTEVGSHKAAFIPMTSTSTMKKIDNFFTTTEENSDSSPKGHIRRSKEPNEDPGDTDDESSPVGEPWVMLLFAAAAAGVVAWRRRRALQSTIIQIDNHAIE